MPSDWVKGWTPPPTTDAKIEFDDQDKKDIILLEGGHYMRRRCRCRRGIPITKQGKRFGGLSIYEETEQRRKREREKDIRGDFPIQNIFLLQNDKNWDLWTPRDSLKKLYPNYWHEQSALQLVAVRRSTGNDVSGHYFRRYFLFFSFSFFFSVVNFSHRRSAWIKLI